MSPKVVPHLRLVSQNTSLVKLFWPIQLQKTRILVQQIQILANNRKKSGIMVWISQRTISCHHSFFPFFLANYEKSFYIIIWLNIPNGYTTTLKHAWNITEQVHFWCQHFGRPNCRISRFKNSIETSPISHTNMLNHGRKFKAFDKSNSFFTSIMTL